jgi:hypothetical protein
VYDDRHDDDNSPEDGDDVDDDDGDDNDDDDVLCVYPHRFSEGRTSMVVDVYEQFYQNNHINHWSSPLTWFPIDPTSALPSSIVVLPSSPTITADTPTTTSSSIEAISYEMDLHEFSRGMAYAAIKVALREVRRS